MNTICYLGLGSNLNEPAGQLRQALHSLSAHPHIVLLTCSSFYGSKAVGPGIQGDYVNAVAHISTTLSATRLLGELQTMELQQGRERSQRWGPRTLDIDILTYGQETIASADLQVPHPRIAERAFVVVPLLEIAPTLLLPDGTSVRSLLDYVCPDDVWRLQPENGV